MAKKKIIEEEKDIIKDNEIILALDVSTKTIGVTLLLDDGSPYGKVIEVTHIRPKIPTKIKGTEALVRKKIIFDEFIKKYTKYKVDHIIIEEPLMASSKSLDTVAVLLKFNGMITSSMYEIFNIVPEYISSYDARKYAFPRLLAIRKRNKNGDEYPYKKIMADLKKGKHVLFGSMPFDVDKKVVLQELVADTYPDIEWVYDKKGELILDNYDASDSMVAALGWIHRRRYGEIDNDSMEISNLKESDGKIEYDLHYWGLSDHKIIYTKKGE